RSNSNNRIALTKILERQVVQNVRCSLSFPRCSTRGPNHDDYQAGDRHARDCRAGGCPACCGSEETQALCLNATPRHLSDSWSVDATTRTLWGIWTRYWNRHGPIGGNVLVAFGRRDQRTPYLEQYHSPRSLSGMLMLRCRGRSSVPRAA